MLLNVKEVLRTNSRTRFKKILQLQCDECSIVFERRWQKEVHDQELHFCGRRCQGAWFSKQTSIHEMISQSTKRNFEDVAFRQRCLEALALSRTQEWHENVILGAQRRWHNATDIEREENRRRSRAWYDDPINYESFVQKHRTPMARSERRDRQLVRWSNPENVMRMSEWSREQWQPGGIFRTPEFALAQSAAQKAVWTDEYRRNRSGSNNPMSARVVVWWKPWMTELRDDIKWANEIRRLSGNACLNCGKSEFTNEEYDFLFAHHISPKSCNPELRFDLNNGIALCKDCHIGRNGVHNLLKRDPEKYEELMRELLKKRIMSSCAR